MKITDNSLDKLKDIVNGAPEGATHYGADGQYWKVTSICDMEDYYSYPNGINAWVEEDYFYGNQLISDLQEIVELHEEIDRLNNVIDNPQGLQEVIFLDQIKNIPLLEIHRANQKLHDENNELKNKLSDVMTKINQLAGEDSE